jgi:hypothetical protein
VSQQINLFNPIFLTKEKVFSSETMGQALALILIALGAFYVYARRDVRSLEEVASAAEHQLADARGSLISLGGALSPQRRSKLLEAELVRDEKELRAKQALLDSLHLDASDDGRGYSRYFAAFARRTLPGVWLTGFSVADGGEQLDIRGRVLHPDLVPAYIRALNKEPAMRGRSVTLLKLAAHREPPPRPAAAAAGPSRYVEFELSMPLAAPMPTKEARK